MNNVLKRGPVQTMVLVFVLLNAFFVLGKDLLAKYGIDNGVVIIGNLILFLVGIFTITKSAKAINDPNPHVFVRSFYAGFLIRLMVCAVAAFVYIYSNDGVISKNALFTCMAIYAIYAIIEVSWLRKLLQQKKNA